MHHQIGGDRAGPAEQIVHRRVGGVAQRRVVHRPGGERERRHHGEAEQRNAAEFAQAPPQHGAEMAGEEGHAVEAAIDHRHRIALVEHDLSKTGSTFGIML